MLPAKWNISMRKLKFRWLVEILLQFTWNNDWFSIKSQIWRQNSQEKLEKRSFCDRPRICFSAKLIREVKEDQLKWSKANNSKAMRLETHWIDLVLIGQIFNKKKRRTKFSTHKFYTHYGVWHVTSTSTFPSDKNASRNFVKPCLHWQHARLRCSIIIKMFYTLNSMKINARVR